MMPVRIATGVKVSAKTHGRTPMKQVTKRTTTRKTSNILVAHSLRTRRVTLRAPHPRPCLLNVALLVIYLGTYNNGNIPSNPRASLHVSEVGTGRPMGSVYTLSTRLVLGILLNN
jgi:hypothetical protein